jgi:protein TonB
MSSSIDMRLTNLQRMLQTGKCHPLFASAIVFSLLLHLLASLALLAPSGKAVKGPEISYLELKDFPFESGKAPAPPPSPQPTPARDITAAPRETALPAAEPAQQTQAADREAKEPAAPAASDQAAQLHSPLGMGLTTGHFSSLGDGETLRDDIRQYYFDMLRVVNETWWLKKPSKSAGFREAIVHVVIERSGKIVMKRLLQSSGNAEFDRSILQALEAATPLPPLPGSYRQDFFTAPLRFIPPLNLLAF